MWNNLLQYVSFTGKLIITGVGESFQMQRALTPTMFNLKTKQLMFMTLATNLHNNLQRGVV